MGTVAKTEASVPKTHAQQLHESQLQRKRRFQANVSLTWLVLFLFLLLIFSSYEVKLSNGTTELSLWQYEKVTREDGREVLERTRTVIATLPFGLSGEGVTVKAILIDRNFVRENFSFIAGGLYWTVRISLFSIILATILALLAALARLSTFPPFYALSTFYVSLIRGTPLYLQILFFFLALPQLNIRLTGEMAGVLALGLNYGAYMSEIFRAGIASVGKGQREAAIAIGMTPAQTMRRIVLPQALRFAIPPVGNDFIAMTKDSALVAATGFVHELTWNAQKVGRSQFRSLEALVIAAIFYWIMTILLTYVQGIIEARLARGDR
ncbi:MAG: amino acid ABC transporter permease [Anaerolineales bacterium]|nr:amino acid ABC transporter permease [Anaerolineales bacterium]NUQ85195.1 amino acid ABC transporter permease [Anaerolineales bacterium]